MNTHQLIFAATLGGQITQDKATPLLEIANGKPLLREVPDPNSTEAKLNIKPDFVTVDNTSVPLQGGKNYLLGYPGDQKKSKVLREEFGYGNILDTYYRIFYLGEDLEEHFLVVNAEYPHGVTSPALYQAPLVLV